MDVQNFSEYFQRISRISVTTDIVTRSLCSLQNALTAHERARVEQMIQEEERLLMEQSELRVDVIDLTRLAQIKVHI